MSGLMLSLVRVVCLTRPNRTLYESKGLEFNDVNLTCPRTHLITEKTKVLLYNFFGDSTATLNQWRLVLNRVSESNGLSDAPSFDETRHATICVEARHLWPSLSLLPNSCSPG